MLRPGVTELNSRMSVIFKFSICFCVIACMTTGALRIDSSRLRAVTMISSGAAAVCDLGGVCAKTGVASMTTNRGSVAV